MGDCHQACSASFQTNNRLLDMALRLSAVDVLPIMDIIPFQGKTISCSLIRIASRNDPKKPIVIDFICVLEPVKNARISRVIIVNMIEPVAALPPDHIKAARVIVSNIHSGVACLEKVAFSEQINPRSTAAAAVPRYPKCRV